MRFAAAFPTCSSRVRGSIGEEAEEEEEEEEEEEVAEVEEEEEDPRETPSEPLRGVGLFVSAATVDISVAFLSGSATVLFTVAARFSRSCFSLCLRFSASRF